jgi:hypothetical protein
MRLELESRTHDEHMSDFIYSSLAKENRQISQTATQ